MQSPYLIILQLKNRTLRFNLIAMVIWTNRTNRLSLRQMKKAWTLLSHFVLWILGSLFVLLAFVLLFTQGWLTSLLLAITGVLIMPVTQKWINQNIAQYKNLRWFKKLGIIATAVFTLFISAVLASPKSNSSNNPSVAGVSESRSSTSIFSSLSSSTSTKSNSLGSVSSSSSKAVAVESSSSSAQKVQGFANLAVVPEEPTPTPESNYAPLSEPEYIAPTPVPTPAQSVTNPTINENGIPYNVDPTYYSGSCTLLKTKGLGDFPRWSINYSAKRDSDGDGIACEINISNN
jgi:hypothetical protein